MADGYCDLCINVDDQNKKQIRSLLTKCLELSYKTVALNQNVDESIFDAEKPKKKKKTETNEVVFQFPEPVDVQDLREEFRGKLNILSRLTFSFTDSEKTYRLGKLVAFKMYNLFAVVPMSQAALQFACSQLNVDIIYINALCSLKFNRKLYIQALNRGVYFEIQYASIVNPETRKLALNWSHLFHMYGKSKNIFVSSGTDNLLYLRNPYDIILLGPFLGLNTAKSKAAVYEMCHNLCYKAEKRLLGKSTFSIPSANLCIGKGES